jgi:hypothetical protein
MDDQPASGVLDIVRDLGNDPAAWTALLSMSPELTEHFKFGEFDPGSLSAFISNMLKRGSPLLATGTFDRRPFSDLQLDPGWDLDRSSGSPIPLPFSEPDPDGRASDARSSQRGRHQ